MRTFLLRWVLTLLRLSESSVSTKRHGTIIVHVDGLSYAVLSHAIKRGYCPFLKQLISRGWRLTRYLSGIPSMTTFAQAGLFYGKNDHISGFSWYDRVRKRFVRGDNGKQMREEERHFQSISKPLLKDGSCLLAVYSGGATLTVASPKALDARNPLSILVKLRILFVPFINPIRFWRIIVVLTSHLLAYTLRAVAGGSIHTISQKMKFLLMRILVCDLLSMLARIELVRRTPVLFVNFPLYDSIAHIHGTRHPLAYQAVGIIDSYCRDICRTAQNVGRLYRLVILSDHGQADAVPFDTAAGETLTSLFIRLVSDQDRRVIQTYGVPSQEIGKESTVYIVPSSSIANVYFSERITRPYKRAEIEKLYPLVMGGLCASRPIGWVLVRETDSRQILYGKEGQAEFCQGRIMRVQGRILQDTTDPDPILRMLASFSQGENTGDIVIFGGIVDGKAVCFEPFVGTHGGFTGEMIWPFVLSDDDSVTPEGQSDRTATEVFRAIRAIRWADT